VVSRPLKGLRAHYTLPQVVHERVEAMHVVEYNEIVSRYETFQHQGCTAAVGCGQMSNYSSSMPTRRRRIHHIRLLKIVEGLFEVGDSFHTRQGRIRRRSCSYALVGLIRERRLNDCICWDLVFASLALRAYVARVPSDICAYGLRKLHILRKNRA
jgi:hypothetical protein